MIYGYFGHQLNMAAHPYDTRRHKVDYKQLVECAKLPRTKKICTPGDKQLFPVEILEAENNQVKVHYIGYGKEDDEWKDKSEIETVLGEDDNPASGIVETDPLVGYQPFSLYKELRIRIKRSLTCNRTASPLVKISMPFDIFLFNGGLKCYGVPSEKKCGIQHYKVNNYSDLDDLLGSNWHFRGLNVNGDYGYAVLETINFYIHKSKSLVEFMPSKVNNTFASLNTSTGYSLVFCFVCNYGTADTFGKDKKIFV